MRLGFKTRGWISQAYFGGLFCGQDPGAKAVPSLTMLQMRWLSENQYPGLPQAVLSSCVTPTTPPYYPQNPVSSPVGYSSTIDNR